MQKTLAEARLRARGPGRHRLHAGPGLAGALLVGASVANALGLRAGQARHRRPSSRRAPAVAAAGRPEAGVSVRRAAGLGRAHAALRCRRRRPLSAARRHAGRRRRRSVRQDGQAPGICRIRAVRRWRRLAERGRAGAVSAAATDARFRRSRFQLFGAQDRGADACARAKPAAPTGRRCPMRARRTSRANSRRRSSTCSSRSRSPRSTRPARTRLVVAGGVGANRELARAARSPTSHAAAAERVLSRPRVLHRQRRDDRARRRVAPRVRDTDDYRFDVRPRWPARRSRRAERRSAVNGRSCVRGRRAAAGCWRDGARTEAPRSAPSPTRSANRRRRRTCRAAAAPRGHERGDRADLEAERERQPDDGKHQCRAANAMRIRFRPQWRRLCRRRT